MVDPTIRQPGPFGGLLGGLLAGGLLGSLLFGGAFSGIGLLDILLIGGGLFLLFRFLRSRQTALETPGGFQPSRERQSSWDALRSAPGSSAPRHASAVPAGFDTEEFLRGAKTAYTRMQNAWDAQKALNISVGKITLTAA